MFDRCSLNIQFNHILTVSVLLIAPPAVWAAAQPASLAACAVIRSNAERLACYDALAAADKQSFQAPAVDEIHRPASTRADSLLDGRWELSADSKLGVFNIRAHRPMYLLPVFWSSDPNQTPRSENPLNQVDSSLGLRQLENKFQLSFKTKVIEGLLGERSDLWFGYTQSSRWQLYNEDDSRPFRETNYEPEINWVFGLEQPLLGGWSARMLSLGGVHQSNGRSLPLSRSWDRLTVAMAIEREGWVAVLRPWWRIGERASKDDNPAIENYIGRADVQIVHQRGEHEFAWLLRHSLRSGEQSRGAVQFDWTFPLHRNLRGHLQWFDGYGESLIDYNHRASYIGIGLSLLSWY